MYLRKNVDIQKKKITRSVKQRPVDVIPHNSVEFSNTREHKFDFCLMFVNSNCYIGMYARVRDIIILLLLCITLIYKDFSVGK